MKKFFRLSKNKNIDLCDTKKQKRFFTHEDFFRRMKWLFSKSGVMALAFEHFLAMFPATILVPIMVNNAVGTTVIDMSLVLFTSGVGTILFIIISKGRIPAYLGSSFAYIGLTIYLLQEQMNDGVSPDLAYMYVGWSYIFGGILLILLSLIYRKKGIDKVLSFLLPTSVVGPAISLIGLELASTAIVDSGFDVSNGLVDSKAAITSIVTLFVIILFSLLRHRIMKNAAIIIGMICGYVVHLFMNGLPLVDGKTIDWITIPKFHIPLTILPPNLLGLFISVIPATFIVYTENIGRTTVINRMINDESNQGSLFNSYSMKYFEKTLLSHGMSTLATTLMGSVPNTIYAENIAVMGISRSDTKRKDPDKFVQNLIRPFSWFPYILAALIAILFSFVGVLQSFLISIPKAIVGGMELFLFGIISAPGIQLLVEEHINYKKVSNQIITASVLISGVSGLSLNLGLFELKGMSLGFIIGVSLNIIVQILKWIGNISDSMSLDELLIICLSALLKERSKMKILEIQSLTNKQDNIKYNSLIEFDFISIPVLYQALIGDTPYIEINSMNMSADFIRNVIKHSSRVIIGIDEKDLIMIKKTANGLFVYIRENALERDVVTKYLNDYPEVIDGDGEFLCIDVEKNIPMRKIRAIIQSMSNYV